MRWVLAVAALWLLPPVGAEELSTDARTGLVIDEGWVFVNAHCGACHSHRLVTAQRGDAKFWLSTIRWMQRTQNLWDLPAEQEQAIVAYLAKHYDETEWGRRPALSPALLPGAAATDKVGSLRPQQGDDTTTAGAGAPESTTVRQ
ncbi:MAG: hypothetical protein AAGC71_00140 [Pseudomonadota bacterium]